MATSTTPAGRIGSVDIVRGLAMVFMALDHIRDYVSRDHFQPEDLSRGSAALFATRWFTHFCAPAFFLLAGTGIGLSRGMNDRAALSRFLATRGLWLLVLDLVITPVLWQFGPPPIPALALTLWALGWSMIVMALVIHVDTRIVLFTALVLIAGHNLFDGLKVTTPGLSQLWSFLHARGFLVPGALIVVYPLIPWVAVMALGYVLAALYRGDAARRRSILLWAGSGAVLLFVVLRLMNGYGNPTQWAWQRSPALTVASFLNVTKQAPSLMFLAMTLGPIFVLLALTERARGPVAEWLAVYGRVPLVYYVLHIAVSHLVALPLPFIQGGEWMRLGILTDIESFPDWYGLGLPGVYLYWGLVVALCYYPCRWWARLKATRTDWWLRYM